MGVLSSIFGSDKSRDRLVEGAVTGLDKLRFTNEERAEANAQTREWFLRYLEASQPQNLARRFIALIIVGLWAFLILFGVGVYYFDVEYSQFVFNVLLDIVTNPFLMVMAFYFAAHMIRAYAERGKDK